MRTRSSAAVSALPKAPTGIPGLDEITEGGFPRGRPTLVCGIEGSGKTLLAMEFLVRGATQYNEPGLFVSFEETDRELATNVASLGFEVPRLVAEKKLLIDFVLVDRRSLEETGEFDLDGLFIRMSHAIDRIQAKRVVLDTVESLFSGLANMGILRCELRRLFHWLKAKGVTVVVTAERGEGALTRRGLEEYVSDCVLLLDHRVSGQVSTRRLRVVKYRGSLHGTNEYPFLITRSGVSVQPITALSLDHHVSTERISTGVAQLDAMLGGKGFFRGSSILVSGTAGTGKTSMAATFVSSACAKGKRSLYFAFEEPPRQIIRNLRSIGVNLKPSVDNGRLRLCAARPTLYGLETHLAMMQDMVEEFSPEVVVLDPITSFTLLGQPSEIRVMLTRLVDLLKAKQITAFFTCLMQGNQASEATQTEISSLVDTWVLLRDIEVDGERNRGIHVLKARGTAHSNQVREFVLTPRGIELKDVYLGPGGVLTGSARVAQEAREKAAQAGDEQELDVRHRGLLRKRRALAAQIAALQAAFMAEEAEDIREIRLLEHRARTRLNDRVEMARSRRTGT
jgi:circadian clock protein KaiC